MKHPPRNTPVDWIEAVWSTDLKSDAKLIACCLRRYMNAKNDMAWPSVSRIAGECGLSESTVHRQLKILREEGWLTVVGESNVKTKINQASFPECLQGGVTQTGVSERQLGGVTQTPELNKELNNGIRGWGEWIEYRKEIKKKMTPATIRKQVTFLEKYPPDQQQLIINQSIQNGWTGLFDLKESTDANTKKHAGQHKNPRRVSGGDITRQLREEARRRELAN